MAALGRAMDVYRAWRANPEGVTAEQLQAAHPELRELLAPLLEPDGDGGLPAEALGDYDLEQEIGRGGMGVVYRARDRTLGRHVAVKVLSPQLQGDARALGRFRREAATVAGFHHPGIVEVFGVGEQDGRWYFAMELVRGAPLDRVLAALRERADRSGRVVRQAVAALTAGDGGGASDGGVDSVPGVFDGSHVACVVALAVQLCDAVAHAHSAGILHRDIKPANVLVTPGGRVVLTDFGLARAEGGPSVTVTGQFAGTPYYVSPEQAAGAWDRVGPRADVFSLGATLYEMLLLQRPFEGTSAQEVLDRIRDPAPLASQEMAARLPHDLAAILGRALEKAPEDRYPSVAALGEDLRAFQEMRPVSARRPGWARRAVRWARREPLRATLAATLALGVPTVVGLGAYLTAKAPAIAAGEAERALQARRSRIAAAYASLFHDPASEAARRRFEALLREDPDDLDAALGVVLHAFRTVPEGADTSGHVEQQLAELGMDVSRHPLLMAIVRGPSAGALATLPPGADAQQHHAAGMFHYMTGRRAGARDTMALGLSQLQQSVMLAPRPVEAHLSALAHCAFDLREDEVVRRACAALAFHFPESVFACTTRAYVLATLDPQQAREAAEQAVRADPRGRVARSRLAALQYADGQLEAAADAYRAVLDTDPEDPIALTNLWMLAHEAGDAAAAEQWLARLRAAHPDDVGLRRIDARLAMEAGAYAEAQHHLQRLRHVDGFLPGDAADLASALIHQNQAEAARAVLAPAMALHGNHGRLVVQWAQALQMTEGAAAALEYLDGQSLDRPSARALRGALHAMLERWEEAVADLERAAAQQPLAVGMTRNLAIALEKVGRVEDARAVAEAGVDRYPTDRRLHGLLLGFLFDARDGAAVLEEMLRFSAAIEASGDPDAALQVLEGMLPLPAPPALPAAEARAYMEAVEALRARVPAGDPAEDPAETPAEDPAGQPQAGSNGR